LLILYFSYDVNDGLSKYFKDTETFSLGTFFQKKT
jgi:hypothetical protein